eukprot:2182160-Pleurochrysis_carterae.AAC.1
MVLNLGIKNALGDGPVALRDFSTLDVKIELKITLLGQDQREGHHCSSCHPDHRLAWLFFLNPHSTEMWLLGAFWPCFTASLLPVLNLDLNNPFCSCRPADLKIHPTGDRAHL